MTATSNIIPFGRNADPLGFAPGVPPFDRANPDHVRAWNSLVQFGRHQWRTSAQETLK